ncbi:phosphoric monoester hydrolase [Basidiobolus meristosporus CBS 931.73]|uniref:Phosphoric monoester hydrolase n=1 Tax=Basidiobolus meristosporus CBS 931.73 TaxID=1314790 RepID=A0A1Y1YJT1_9FUNG|nr:phosphoric monoester hydrolase [Basidiobolus meristosporus CBS 931.73]|eukprot:ORX98103.1 phosphoric monoester hydrolase [Basidiobolus meristosporus CBS 931.73]
MSTINNLFIFSDFDGTITKEDSLNILIDKCMGSEPRQSIDDAIKQGTMSFKEGMTRQFAGIDASWEEASTFLQSTTHVDPHFKEFAQYCDAENIPLTVVSCGIGPLIKEFLKGFVGSELASKIQVEANSVEIIDQKWIPVYHDDSDFGHDKSLTMRQIKATLEVKPILVFLGDGLSDISAAREADILFAKKGCDLEDWCIKENVSYTSFENFSHVLEVLKKFIATREM